MKNYTTQENLDKLKKELDQLENVERHKIAKELKEAISFGDLSENAAYDSAKESQGILESKIAELQAIIKTAIIVEKSSGGKVQIGCKVTVVSEGETDTYEIVGVGQSDPAQGKISYEAPLASALLDHAEGDEVEVDFDGEKVKYKITKVE